MPAPPRLSRIPQHTGIFKLHLQAEATLNSQSLQDAVKLPVGINKETWIASQLISTMRDLNCLINGVLECHCSFGTCPHMSAGKYVTYKWAEDRAPQPVDMPAKEYMHKLADYADERLSDARLLPQSETPLPAEFMDEALLILKRVFRCYAHAYLHHFEHIQQSGDEAHINFIFKRFVYFVREFDLVAADDMHPLKDLIDKFMKADADRRNR